MKRNKIFTFILLASLAIELCLFISGSIGFPVGGGHIPVPLPMAIFYATGWMPAVLGLFFALTAKGKIRLVFLASIGSIIFYFGLMFVAEMMHVG